MIGSVAKRAASAVSLLLHWLSPNRPRGTVGILLYHRVAEVVEGLPAPTLNVTPAILRRQLEGLKDREFQFLTLQAIRELCANGQPLPDRATVVTFDDGYENVYLNAWPILRELEIPATIFVNTAQLDSDEPFSCDQWGQQHQGALALAAYRPLQHSQCREMLDSGLIDIGAHTHTHGDFRGRPDELYADLMLNVAHLRRELGLEQIPFAFPYGRVSLGFAGGAMNDAARRAGVTCALTTECVTNQPTDDPFSWGRFNVYDWDTAATLEAKLAGWYGWVPRLQDLVAKCTLSGRRLEKESSSRVAGLETRETSDEPPRDSRREPAAIEPRHSGVATPRQSDASIPEPIAVRDPRWQELTDVVGLRAIAAAGLCLNRVLGRASGSAPGIVTYHRISPHVPGLPKPQHNVPPRQLRRQLTGLLRRGFVPWPLERLLEHHESNQRTPPRVFAVTFDDGFETVYTRALPILRELKIPATVFVSTIYLDRYEPFSFDEWGVQHEQLAPAESYRPLTWDQCHEMAESGLFQFGAHTHTHQDFRGRADDFQGDLHTSIEIVRQQFGMQKVPFAFPFGSPRRGHAGPELVAAAKRTDVTCGLTTEPITVDVRSDPFTWGRFNAFSWDSPGTLAAKLDGWYSWGPKVKRRIGGTVRRVFRGAVAASRRK